MPRPCKPASPFRYFNSSPEVIRLVVLMYVRFPLSLRNVEDLLFERGKSIEDEAESFGSCSGKPFARGLGSTTFSVFMPHLTSR